MRFLVELKAPYGVWTRPLFFLLTFFYVRFYGLWDYTASIDEVFTLTLASRDNLWSVFINSFKDNVHPPINYFLLHLLLQISSEPWFLRLGAIMPGIIFPFIFYFIAERSIGRYAGLFVLFAMGFGYASVAFTQNIRTYSLSIFFLSLIMLNFFKLVQNSNSGSRPLYLLLIFSFLAIFTNYTMGFVIAIMCSYLFLHFSMNGGLKNLKAKIAGQISILVFGNALIALALYIFFQYKFSHSPSKLSYGPNAFPATTHGFADNFFDIINLFIFHETGSKAVSMVFAVLYFFGIYRLFKTRNLPVLAIAVAPVVITMLLCFLRLYPFSAYRHSFFLMPSILFGISAAFQYAGNKLKVIKEKYFPANNKLFPAFVIITALALTLHVSNSSFYRNIGISEMWRKEGFDKNEEALFLKANKEKDVILMQDINARYFIYKAGADSVEKISAYLRRFKYRGHYIYFYSQGYWPVIDTKAKLLKLLMDVDHKVNIKSKDRVWYIRPGRFHWRNEVFSEIKKEKEPFDVSLKQAIIANQHNYGGYLISLDAKAVSEYMVRNKDYPFHPSHLKDKYY